MTTPSLAFGLVRLGECRRCLHATVVIVLGLIGLAVLETSMHSVLFDNILHSPIRLPVLPVFVLSALAFAVLLIAVDRTYPFLWLWDPQPNAASAPRPEAMVTWLCLAAMAAIVYGVWSLPLDMPLEDVFHEGEILSAYAFFNRSGPADLPVLIHGPGLDLLPTALAAIFAAPGHGIVFARFVEGIAHTLTAVLSALAGGLLAWRILPATTPATTRRMLAAAAGLTAMVLAVVLAGADNRLVVFLIALILTAELIAAARPRRAAWLAGALGVACALSPIYVYSAALETAAMVGAGFLIMFVRDFRATLRTLPPLAAGLLIGLALAFAAGLGELYRDALRDILYWATTGRGMWAIPTRGYDTLFGILVVIGLLGLCLALAWRSTPGRSAAESDRAALLWFMAAAVLAGMRNVMERPDFGHLGIALVTAAAVLAAVATPLLLRLLRWRPAGVRVALAGCGTAVVLLSLLGAGPAPQHSFLALGTPDNRILPEDVRAFREHYADQLAASDCLLVLTNEGVLDYAADLPPCGGFLYPIYASTPSADAALAAWLRAHPQRIVVTKTVFWSGRIDNKTMPERLPAVFAVLDETMPVHDDFDGWEVRLSK